MQLGAAVSDVVEGVVPAAKHRRRPALPRHYSSHRVSAQNSVQRSVVGQPGPPLADRDIVRAVGMEDIADVEHRGPVALPEVAQGEGVVGAGPRIAAREAETVAEGVIRVVLQTVPGSLAKIDLQTVVIGVACGNHLSAGIAATVGVGLEEVNGVARARACIACVRGAGREAGADQIAEERDVAVDAGKSAGERSRLAGVQIVDELRVGVIGGIGPAESCIENWRRVAVTAGEGTASRCSQVRLSVFEVLQESVFEDIDFVGIDANPVVDRAIAVVADLQRHRTA